MFSINSQLKIAFIIVIYISTLAISYINNRFLGCWTGAYSKTHEGSYAEDKPPVKKISSPTEKNAGSPSPHRN